VPADLHDLITVLHAPDLVLSASDGQIRTDAHGWYSRDRRAIARLEIELDSGHAATIGQHRDGASTVTVVSAVTGIATESTDPTIMLSRHRTVSPSALTDRVELTNYGTSAVAATLRARVGTDLAGLDAVRAGRLTPPARPLLHDNEVRWENRDITVVLRSSVPPSSSSEAGELTWDVDLSAGATWTLELSGECHHTSATVFTPTAATVSPQWTVTGDELVSTNLADLKALLMADPEAPGDVFTAAGAPWYLTLFGRDALWTARLLLPLGTELAAGTLRTLARRQGVARHEESEEAPGKILHEARPAPQHVATMRLPAVYYGTIDATALWVCLLHDAWRAGMPAPEVAALLGPLVPAR